MTQGSRVLVVDDEPQILRALQTNLSLPDPERSLGADDFMILAKVLSRQARHREAYEAGSQALASFRQQLGAQDQFIAQIEELVEELRRKSDKGTGVDLKPNRAEQGASAEQPRE